MMIIHISRNECITIFSQGLRSGTDRLLRCRLQRRKRRLGSDWSGTLEHFPCQDWLHWLFCSAGGGDCRGAQASMAGHHQPGELITVDGRGLMIVDEPPVFPSRFHRTSICIYSIWHGGDHHFAKDPQGVQPRIPSLPLLTQHPQLKS